MSDIRDRIIQAGTGWCASTHQHDNSKAALAAACEALRIVAEHVRHVRLPGREEFDAIEDGFLEALLAEIETGSREDKNDLGGPSPTEAAGTGARVPAPELPHDGSGSALPVCAHGYYGGCIVCHPTGATGGQNDHG